MISIDIDSFSKFETSSKVTAATAAVGTLRDPVMIASLKNDQDFDVIASGVTKKETTVNVPVKVENVCPFISDKCV